MRHDDKLTIKEHRLKMQNLAIVKRLHPAGYLCLVLLCLFSMQSFALYCANPGGQGSGTISETGNISDTGKVQYYKPINGTKATGSTTITFTASTSLAANDMVLVIQMQGADINSTQSSSYGNGVSGSPASGWLNNTNFKAGYYEYATVLSSSGSTITLKQGLVHSYHQADAGTQGKRRYQVIRVPQYTSLTLSGNLTSKAWDGDTGGVLPLDVANTLDFNGHSITMAAKGFRGGGGRNHTGRSGLSNADFRQPSRNNNNGAHGSKGEGIAGTPRYTWDGTSSGRQDNTTEGYPNGSYAMGAPANAGGGGTDGMPSTNEENAGGGGGGNGGAGGRGGNSWRTNLPTGGWGGAAFPAAPNRIVMGGGGGAGTMNNYDQSGVYPHGGVGGGIVLIRAGSITGTGTINANGGGGPIPANDGAGGGGAGGSVVVIANSQTGSLTINAKGGNGGNVNFGDPHGPGGGGGGGVVFTNSAVSALVNTSQGQSGRAGNGTTQWPYQYFGATPSGGASGNSIPNASPEAIDGTDPGSNCYLYQSDLVIEKVRNSGSMQAGGVANFLITVTNNGPDATVATIQVTDVLDSRFTYVGFSGTGWTCSATGQVVSCLHTGVLANQASSQVIIQTQIAAVATRQTIFNTASVALAVGSSNNSDPIIANNSATLEDTIYGATESGNKFMYLYPTSTTVGTLDRSVPTVAATQNMGTGSEPNNRLMTLSLTPFLSGNLSLNAEDILVKVCMKPSNTGNQRLRQVSASLYQGSTQIGSTNTVAFSNHNYLFYIFALPLNSAVTVNSGTALSLRLQNVSNDTSDTVTISNNADGTDCLGEGPSRVEVETSTVINVSSVKVFNQPHPAGIEVSRVLEGSTVYVRSVVTDPFGHADINNNSIVDVMNGTSVLAGNFAQTAVLSATGNTKTFEYAVVLPTVPSLGQYDLRVTANEGTEGTIRHRAAAAIELTSDPALTVNKQVDKSEVSPGEEVRYSLQVNNSSLSTVGDAYQITVVDVLPEFTSLKIQAPIVEYTDGGLSPFINSGLTVANIEYSNDGGATWVYTPVSEAGGAPVGFDALVQQIRIRFNGKMVPNTAFKLEYSLRLD